MDKVNEFEHAADEMPSQSRYGIDDKRFRDTRTDAEANINYAYAGEDIISDTEALRTFILHHNEHQKPRLEILHNYYEGINANMLESYRRKEEDKADHRASHSFAEYISDFTNGYFLGNPISVIHEHAQDKLKEVHNYNDIDSLNRELGLDLAIYGRAYELILKNHKDEYRLYRSEPESTFIIYDNSIEMNSIAAIRYYPEDVNVDKDSMYIVDVYTATEYHQFRMQMEIQSDLTHVQDDLHFYDRVPITEYRNNRDRRGDFEKVIPQIDLYDRAQADTANYMTDLNDALLVLMGNMAVDGAEVREQKKANVLILEPPEYTDNQNGNIREGNIDAKYIYKQYDVQGSEAYKERLEGNIHLLSNTPHMGDEQFSGTTSGEAMKYKMFGLEQKTVMKEGMFIKGLRRRYKLLQTIMQLDKELDSTINLNEIEYKFVRNLPKSVVEDLKAFVQAGGQLSLETLINMFAFVPDAEAEIKKLFDEKNKELNSESDEEYDNFIPAGSD